MSNEKHGSIQNALKAFIERHWPLPSPEKRQEGFLSLKQTFRFFNLKKDGEYLCYRLINNVFVLGAVIYAAVLIDLHSGTGLLIDSEKFEHDKLLFPVTFSRLIAWPALLIALAYYLRIRLPLNIREDAVPVMMHRALLVGYGRRRWIWRVLFMGTVAIVAILLSHIVVARLAYHFEQQDSAAFVLTVGALFGVICPPMGAALLVSYALVAEKVVRDFHQFERDLLSMGPLPRSY